MDEFKNRDVTLSHLDIIVVDVSQIESFKSAVGTRHSRQAILLRWFDADGAWGIGECSCRPDPYFSHEFLAGVIQVIAEFVFPKLNASQTYGELLQILHTIRGWGFAQAVVLDAVHDLWRRKGMKDPLDAWSCERVEKVPVGISLGLYPTPEALVAKVSNAVAAGYQRVKLKIKPGLPTEYLAAVREAFPDLYLGVDANGSFDTETFHELLVLEDLKLANLEQPFPPDRLDLCAELKIQAPSLVICLDESVYAFGHLVSAIKMSAIDELNIKPGRVGGILNAMDLAQLCQRHKLSVWVGGMFETSIGRSANLRFAACFPHAKAHDLSPSSRYFKKDLVQMPVAMDAFGFVDRPDDPVVLDESAIGQFVQSRIVKRIS